MVQCTIIDHRSNNKKKLKDVLYKTTAVSKTCECIHVPRCVRIKARRGELFAKTLEVHRNEAVINITGFFIIVNLYRTRQYFKYISDTSQTPYTTYTYIYFPVFFLCVIINRYPEYAWRLHTINNILYSKTFCARRSLPAECRNNASTLIRVMYIFLMRGHLPL